VEVAGLMYFWNLSIDTVTCIQLVLAIGLAVDYSAHIGHTFMTVTGTRNGKMNIFYCMLLNCILHIYFIISYIIIIII